MRRRSGGHIAVRVLLLLVAGLWLSAPVRAAGPPTAPVRTVGGVIDYARLFTPDEIRALEQMAGPLARAIGTDVFVVTVDDGAGIWKDLGSHYRMVSRVVADVGAAVKRHFEREAPLTVLLVFKNSVVMHLRTSRAELQERLLLKNFYGGVERIGIRTRNDEAKQRHAAAAQVYLASFAEVAMTVAEPERTLWAQIQRFGIEHVFKEHAIVPSREITSYWWLESAQRVFHQLLRLFAALTPLPGWSAFLLFMALVHLAFQPVERLLDRKAGLIGNWLVKTCMLPPMAFLFAVTQCDLENLQYVSQALGGDFKSYLSWAINFDAVNKATLPELPLIVLVIVALAICVLELLRGLQRLAEANEKIASSSLELPPWIPDVAGPLWQWATPTRIKLSTLTRMLGEPAFVLSAMIFPGLIAAYFCGFALLKRAPIIWQAVRGRPKEARSTIAASRHRGGFRPVFVPAERPARLRPHARRG